MQFGGCRVFIVGDNERKIMKMPNPPRDFLLSCLERPNSFQAAHILLSFRYLNLKEIEGGVHIWNGLDLFLGKEDDTTQIKKLTSYWHEKLKAGELEDPNPVLHEDYLKILFRIPVPEPQEVQDAKTLEATK